MLFELSCLAAFIYTLLATAAIIRQETISHTVERIEKEWKEFRHSTEAKPATAPAETDDAESDTASETGETTPVEIAPSPDACTQLRISRQIVRLALVASNARPYRPTASSSASAASSSSALPALEFALELQWQAPQTVLESSTPRRPITYQVDVRAIDDAPLATDESKYDSALPQVEGSQPSVDRYSVVVSDNDPPASAAAFSLHGPNSTNDDVAVPMDADSDGAPGTEDVDLPKARAAPSRKRKAASSTSRKKASTTAASKARTSRSRGWCGGGDDPTSTEGSAHDTSEASPAESSDEGARPRAVLPASASALPSTARSSFGTIRAASTFEQPAFLIEHPSAASYVFNVSTASSAASPSSASSLSFQFNLPPLLFLIQSRPTNSTQREQVLQGFEQLSLELKVQDDLQGIRWDSLVDLLDPSLSSKISKRICKVLGRLAELPSVVRELAVQAPVISALHALAEHRIKHLAEKESSGDLRPYKRSRKNSPAGAPASDASVPMEDVTAAAAVEGETDAADPPVESDELIEPILENIMWLALAVTDLTHSSEKNKVAPSSYASALDSANIRVVNEFLRLGGVPLLLLLCQESSSAWFVPYEDAALHSLVQMFLSPPAAISAADRDALLFFLLHIAQFGTQSARKILFESEVRYVLRNPFARV
jgi:hypothetical protein